MDDAAAFAEANPLQRGLRRLGASGPGSWLFARVLHRIDRPVYRLSGGRTTLAGALAGLPVVMLTTTGARSGRPRTVPLLGLPFEGGVAVIASNFGQRHQPAWLHNLRRDPTAELSIAGGPRRRVRATELEGAARARLWERGLRVYPGWSQYEVRAGDRPIAVFLLEPA